MTTPIAKRVLSRLEKLNLSMRKASLSAGLSDAFIRNITSGKSESPRGINLTKLAQILKTTEVWLLHGDGPEEVDGNTYNLNEDDQEFSILWKSASQEDKQVILALLRSRKASEDL